MTTRITLDDNKLIEIDERKAEVEQLEADYLTGRGWVWSQVGTPSNYWLWQKELPDGRVIMLDTELAIMQQVGEELDAQEIPDDE